MAKSTPTQHAFFVRHVDGRQEELFRRIVLRRVFSDDRNNTIKEEILCSAPLNHLPSYFHVDKEKFGKIGEKYDVRVTAYLVDDNNYVTMVSACHSWIRDTSILIHLKLKGKKNSFSFLSEVNLCILDCDRHTPEWMREK
jgi:hypothetical protein